MYIRTPRIGAVCSADPNDIHALAGDFAYELRQFIKTDRDGERRRAPTPLIAAMRCYVASRLSDEVDVPETLL